MLAMQNWQDTLDGMDSGQTVEVDQEVFDYFLEVLPPVFMSKTFTFKDGLCVRASFGFAEGWEPIKVFWATPEGKMYCRQSELINCS